MGKLIDIFSKKPKKIPLDYLTRTKVCYENVIKDGICNCEICADKRIISERLITISNYLCLDYNKRTGNSLAAGDWFEVLLTATLAVKDSVYPDL